MVQVISSTIDNFPVLTKSIGRPHTFLPNADPANRTFTRHMIPSAPLVMIRPGRIRFSESFENVFATMGSILGVSKEEVETQLTSKTGGVYNSATRYGVGPEDEAALDKAISKKRRLHSVQDLKENGGGSLRYFEFEPTLGEYVSVLATHSQRIFSRLKGSKSWINMTYDVSDTDFGGFYTFWANNATSVSESASADVGESALAGLVKNVSNVSRQAQYFMTSDMRNGNIAQNEAAAGAFETAMRSVSNFAGGGNASGLRASLGDAILGMNPLFPEVWKDSSFGRSYNLAFKFQSPYGDPQSVYQNVLLPFAMLLSLVLPLAKSPATYSEPFNFQLDCPGYFSCDLGICTGFDFVKGGSENLWTVDGLPRAIDVTMQVKDLYPTLMASHNNKSLYLNVGLGTFLDNLAGITLFQSKQFGKSDVAASLRTGINSALQQGLAIPDRISAGMQIFAEEKGISSIARLFGGV